MKRSICARTEGTYFLEGKISEIIADLQEVQKELGPESSIEIDNFESYGSTVIEVRFLRLETDEEESKRQKQETQLEQQRLEEKRKVYERLKKEFEP